MQMYAAHCRWHILQQQLDAAVDRNHDNNGKVKPPRAAQFAPFLSLERARWADEKG